MPRSSPQPSFLVVEDSDEDFMALERILRRANAPARLQRCTSAEQVLTLMRAPLIPDRTPPELPSLIVLDLNLPGLNGRTVLTAVREHPRFRTVPVVIFSTSSNPQDIAWCYENGANSYHVKEMDYSAFKRGVEMLVAYWLELSGCLPRPAACLPRPPDLDPPMAEIRSRFVRVLIVDDSPTDRVIFRRHLTRGAHREYHVNEAGTAAEATALLANELPDCVLVDFHLPEMDGLQFVRQIVRDHGNHTFGIVMLTSAAEISVAVKALQNGPMTTLRRTGLTALPCAGRWKTPWRRQPSSVNWRPSGVRWPTRMPSLKST